MYNPNSLNLSMQFDYSFIRAYPATAIKAILKNNRTIDNDFYNDCKFMHDLATISDFNCGMI